MSCYAVALTLTIGWERRRSPVRTRAGPPLQWLPFRVVGLRSCHRLVFFTYGIRRKTKNYVVLEMHKVASVLDPIVILNLVFDLVILCLASFAYTRGRERKDVLTLWIAVGFFFFAISYVLTILALGPAVILIPLRALGYLSIIAGLYLHLKH